MLLLLEVFKFKKNFKVGFDEILGNIQAEAREFVSYKKKQRVYRIVSSEPLKWTTVEEKYRASIAFLFNFQ